MNSHSNCNCCGNSANASVHQTLSEMDWERGIWNAAFSGDKDKVISLIEKSRNARDLVNSPDNAGYSALHYAAGRGHVDICNILLKHGASIDHQTKSGRATPLHKAAAAGKTSTLKFLIENGANIGLQDDDGKTVLHKVVDNKHYDLIHILIDVSPNLPLIKDNKGNIPNITH
ncbi:ankyrin repeat domain-containing protein 39 [Aricia agestis]|uniref:ankyrin repeat domain-containing protein 39 n=1 Tax=Aricia agestis TaxID=91739 RepID=UPI001C208F91|nr:ankyrin repeat domain-containing protein 39 [Aricia agestis]